jgi:glutathione synthase/RimK-type ligase-like ATP-grasp enzyme
VVTAIWFVTYSTKPSITSDDALAAEALRKHGIEATAQPWDAPCRSPFPAILRSSWNHHLKPAEFLTWLGAHQATGSPLWNHPATIRWNLDKFYLRELEQRGCPTIPTVFLQRGVAADLKSILAEKDWSAAVVKPSISATSHLTSTVTHATAPQQQAVLDSLLTEHSILIQKFMPEIQTIGELSLVFFNGVYSHAMRKNAAPGDFRIQEEYGGRTTGFAVPEAVIEQAGRALNLTPGTPHLYARVDGVLSGTIFFIMEVELIEPCLYLATNAHAPARFAEAIATRLNQ